MKPQAKIASTYWLNPDVAAIIEDYAQGANISVSEALDRMIIQCSQAMITGVVEEVTEKDIFEDINGELQKIDARLSWIEGRLTDKEIEASEEE